MIISDSATDLLTSQPFEFGQALPVRVVHLIQCYAKQRHGKLCFDRQSEVSLDVQQLRMWFCRLFRRHRSVRRPIFCTCGHRFDAYRA